MMHSKQRPTNKATAAVRTIRAATAYAAVQANRAATANAAARAIRAARVNRAPVSLLALLFVFLYAGALPACGYSEYDFHFRLFAPDDLSTGIYVIPSQLSGYEGQGKVVPDAKTLSFCPPDRPWDANLLDWAKMTGNKISYDALATAIYDLPVKEIQQATDAVKAGKTARSSNPFLSALIQAKEIDALNYLLFAKKVEPLVTSGDEWASVAEQQRDLPAMLKAQKEGQAALGVTKNEEIRKRYTYQILRLMHYRQSYKEEVAFADTHLSAKPSLQVEYRSLALKAGALRWLGRKVESKRLFARIADEAPDLREVAVRNFDYIDLNEAEERRLIEQTPKDERNNVLFLLGRSRQGYALDVMKQMEALDPNSLPLRYLAMREMALVEEAILPYYAEGRSAPEEQSLWMRVLAYVSRKLGLDNRLFADQKKLRLPDAEHRSDFLAFVQRRSTIGNDGFWAAMGAYLAFYDGNAALADSLTKSARKGLPSDFIAHRLSLLDLFREMKGRKDEGQGQTQQGPQAATQNDPKKELHYLAEFRRLFPNAEKRKPYELNESGTTLRAFQFLLTDLFKRTNRPGHALLAASALQPGLGSYAEPDAESHTESSMDSHKKSDSQAAADGKSFARDSSELLSKDETALKAVLALYADSGRGALETELLRSFPYGKDNVLDALAGQRMEQEDYAGAVAYYQKQSAAFTKKLVYEYVRLPNPFVHPDEVVNQSATEPWTRRQFAEEMLRLQKKGDAESLYKIGVALYNTSWHGSWWILSRDSWSFGDQNTDSKRLAKAIRSLEAAAAASKGKDDELSARTLVMALRVTRAKEWESEDQWKEGGTAFSGNEKALYRQLETKYGNTRFFRSVQAQCSYLPLLAQ